MRQTLECKCERSTGTTTHAPGLTSRMITPVPASWVMKVSTPCMCFVVSMVSALQTLIDLLSHFWWLDRIGWV